MDFATRDRYRNAIEELARGSGLTEVDVARTAMEMAASAPVGDDVEPAVAARRRDPGYYLISDGRPALERALARPGARRAPAAACLRAVRGDSATSARSRSSPALLLAVPLLLSPATVRIGAGTARRGHPRPRPGVRSGDRARQPDGHQDARARGRCPGSTWTMACRVELRTLVVVPTLLTDEAEVEAQVGGLEVHYLAQPRGRPAVRPAVGLARRADRARRPATTSCSPAAAAAIDRLNERHGEAPGGGARFLLLPPHATLERGRGLLDGLGAQARQAPRAERAAARLDDDRHPRPPDGPASTPPTGRALRGHARRRHATAARRRRATWSGRSPIRSTSRRSIRGPGG